MHVVTRGGKGGACSGGVHGDVMHVVTRAWQSGMCSGQGRHKVATRGIGERHKAARVQL